ncbi:MAG TPA: LysR substrate-binding domain-containing protein [Solirubrobacteraceae bacterium]
MRSVDLRELYYFMVLAEELNFARAANRLYLDRSGLSKAMQRVESSLGVSLITRDEGHLKLTAAGVALNERGEEVLDAFERLKTIAAAVHSGATGALAVGTSPGARHHLVSPIMRRFARSSPEVHIVRREQVATDIAEDLLHGTLDVGIAAGVPAVDGLARETLRQMELHALVASSHPLAKHSSIELADLRGERLLLSSEEARGGWLREIFASAGFLPEFVHDVMDYDEDLHGVRRGDCVRLSVRTFAHAPPPDVVVLALEPKVKLPVEIVWRAQEPPPTLMRFVALARQTAVELGWVA